MLSGNLADQASDLRLNEAVLPPRYRFYKPMIFVEAADLEASLGDNHRIAQTYVTKSEN
jgi:hypothetical protein